MLLHWEEYVEYLGYKFYLPNAIAPRTWVLNSELYLRQALEVYSGNIVRFNGFFAKTLKHWKSKFPEEIRESREVELLARMQGFTEGCQQMAYAKLRLTMRKNLKTGHGHMVWEPEEAWTLYTNWMDDDWTDHYVKVVSFNERTDLVPLVEVGPGLRWRKSQHQPAVGRSLGDRRLLEMSA